MGPFIGPVAPRLPAANTGVSLAVGGKREYALAPAVKELCFKQNPGHAAPLRLANIGVEIPELSTSNSPRKQRRIFSLIQPEFAAPAGTWAPNGRPPVPSPARRARLSWARDSG